MRTTTHAPFCSANSSTSLASGDVVLVARVLVVLVDGDARWYTRTRDDGTARAVVGAGLATPTPTRARALVDAIIAGGVARDVDMRARGCVDARAGERSGASRLYRVVRGCVARRCRRARACGARRAFGRRHSLRF